MSTVDATNYHTMKRSKLKKEIKKLEKAAKASEKKVEAATKAFEAVRKKYDKKLKKLNKAMTRRSIDADTLAQAKEALTKLESKPKSKKASVPTPKVSPSAKTPKRQPASHSANGEEKPTATPKPVAARTPSVQKDDLTLVEGIGPRLAGILNEAGIKSLAQLARRKPASLRKILISKGSAYRIHNPETWPTQAALAKSGKLDELKALQEKLKAGRSVA